MVGDGAADVHGFDVVGGYAVLQEEPALSTIQLMFSNNHPFHSMVGRRFHRIEQNTRAARPPILQIKTILSLFEKPRLHVQGAAHRIEYAQRGICVFGHTKPDAGLFAPGVGLILIKLKDRLLVAARSVVVLNDDKSQAEISIARRIHGPHLHGLNTQVVAGKSQIGLTRRKAGSGTGAAHTVLNLRRDAAIVFCVHYPIADRYHDRA